MTGFWHPPAFSLEPWYSDPADHRCPHDAWLESLEIIEPATGSPGEKRRISIKLTLLGAYHDGLLVFTYFGVRRHSLTSYACDQGVGDWLRDEFSASADGMIAHRIIWHCPASGASQWLIEAAEVTCEWKPQAVPVRTKRDSLESSG